MSDREKRGLHDDDYARLLLSVGLARTIDGLLVSVEAFLFALVEDRRYGVDPEEELRHYLRRPESERILQGILGCRDSFEYLVFETPRFKLIRSFYNLFAEALEEYSKRGRGFARPVECLSQPALWAVERRGVERASPGRVTRPPGIRRPSLLELLLYASLAAALTGIALGLTVG